MEEQQFVEAEQLGGQDGNISFREIVLRHLAKIGMLASKEMRGGYWNETPIMIGGSATTIKTYVEDSREAYSNAVNYLADLLLPHFDKQMVKEEEEVDEELEKIYDEGIEKEWTKEKYNNRTWQVRRKLFRCLCKFLNRQKYMEGKKFEA